MTERPRALLLTVFFISGCTGLIYETVWVRQFTLIFGGTTYAISTVLATYLGGLGLGSALAGRFAARLAQPGRAYGAIEAAVGLYALIVPFLMTLAEPLYRALYPMAATTPLLLNAARFLVGACFLALPTVAMGATLPLLVSHATRGSRDHVGRDIATLYGTNTLGAVVGALLGGLLLIPELGLRATTWTASIANLLIAVVAVRYFATPADGSLPAPSPRSTPRVVPHAGDARTLRHVAVAALVTSGVVSMVFEIAWSRALVMSFGSTTYAFTCILAGFILGLALGSLVVSRVIDRVSSPARLLGLLQLGVGATAICIAPLFALAPLLFRAQIESFGSVYGAILLSQFVIAAGLIVVPTALMGAAFPLAARLLSAGTDPATATGRAYAINTFGTIAGSMLAGFVLIRGDVLGAQWSINVAALAIAVVGALTYDAVRDPAAPRSRSLFLGVGTVAAMTLAARMFGQWNVELLSSGGFRRDLDPRAYSRNKLLEYREGVDSTVSVVQSRFDEHVITLAVNAKPDASTALADMNTQMLLAHLPLMLAPETRNVCVIGLGSGVTLGAATAHRTVERFDCAEICDEVIQVERYFQKYNRNPLADPRVRLYRADGRNHLLLTDAKYDVIISEPSNPYIAGVANLFTAEFFASCEQRLTPRGVLGMWMQGYSISSDDFRLVVRTLADRFPAVSVWQTSSADFLLIASREGIAAPVSRVRERLAQPEVRADLYRIAHASVHTLLGRHIANGEALRRWVGDGPRNTDNHNLLEASAPRQLYGGGEKLFGQTLLEAQHPPFPAMVSPDPQLDADLIERTIGAQHAFRAAYMVERLGFGGGDPRQTVPLLFDAAARDPGNPAVHMQIRAVEADFLRSTPPELVNSPGGRAFSEKLRSTRTPMWCGINSMPLADIARLFVGRAAQMELPAGRIADAIATLRETVEIAPSDPDARILLIAALWKGGAPDEARRALDDALRSGVVSQQALADGPAAEAWRGLTASSAPASAESAPASSAPVQP